MLLDFKALCLITLVTVAAATPISNEKLQARKLIPDSITCNGKTFTKQNIYDAIKQSDKRSGKYPAEFKNKAGDGGKVFPNIPTGNLLLEYPLATPTWKSGKFSCFVRTLYSY